MPSWTVSGSSETVLAAEMQSTSVVTTIPASENMPTRTRRRVPDAVAAFLKSIVLERAVAPSGPSGLMLRG